MFVSVSPGKVAPVSINWIIVYMYKEKYVIYFETSIYFKHTSHLPFFLALFQCVIHSLVTAPSLSTNYFEDTVGFSCKTFFLMVVRALLIFHSPSSFSIYFYPQQAIHCFSFCLPRCSSGCVCAARATRHVGEDRAEGSKPSPAWAVLLQHFPGGPVVSAQWQPWT